MLAAAIGMFDGVHLGHQALVAELCALASERGLQPVAYTFDRHPLLLIAPEKAPKLLTSPQVRCKLLVEAGASQAIALTFDEKMRNLSAREFMELMHREFSVDMLLVGFDHRFGRDRAGNFDTYAQIGKEIGIEVVGSREKVEVETPLGIVPVSSSAIRKALSEADLATANAMLGRCYGFAGTVAHGRSIGHTIGFPTANVVPDFDYQLLPALGSYAAWATVNGQRWPAMVNIGQRPTLDDGNAISIEAHLIGADCDFYGQRMQLDFVAYLRPEKRFPSLEALSNQLSFDKSSALSLLTPTR